MTNRRALAARLCNLIWPLRVRVTNLCHIRFILARRRSSKHNKAKDCRAVTSAKWKRNAQEKKIKRERERERAIINSSKFASFVPLFICRSTSLRIRLHFCNANNDNVQILRPRSNYEYPTQKVTLNIWIFVRAKCTQISISTLLC